MCLVWEAIERCSKPWAFQAMPLEVSFGDFVQQMSGLKEGFMSAGIKHIHSITVTWGFNSPSVNSVQLSHAVPGRKGANVDQLLENEQLSSELGPHRSNPPQKSWHLTGWAMMGSSYWLGRFFNKTG